MDTPKPLAAQRIANDIVTTLELKLNLPDQLAREAQAAGLLTPSEVERLVREALATWRVARLAEAREKLGSAPLAPMTAEEIQTEIDAYRTEARRAAGA